MICTKHLNFKLTSNFHSDLMMLPVYLHLDKLSICSQALMADFPTVILASLFELQELIQSRPKVMEELGL